MERTLTYSIALTITFDLAKPCPLQVGMSAHAQWQSLLRQPPYTYFTVEETHLVSGQGTSHARTRTRTQTHTRLVCLTLLVFAFFSFLLHLSNIGHLYHYIHTTTHTHGAPGVKRYTVTYYAYTVWVYIHFCGCIVVTIGLMCI